MSKREATRIGRRPGQVRATSLLTGLADHHARLAWADATLFLGDFPGAVAILRELHRTLAQVHRPLGNPALVAEHDRLAAVPINS